MFAVSKIIYFSNPIWTLAPQKSSKLLLWALLLFQGVTWTGHERSERNDPGDRFDARVRVGGGSRRANSPSPPKRTADFDRKSAVFFCAEKPWFQGILSFHTIKKPVPETFSGAGFSCFRRSQRTAVKVKVCFVGYSFAFWVKVCLVGLSFAFWYFDNV